MMLFRCDINTCNKEMKLEEVKAVRILNLQYDFCAECFASLESFIKLRLSPGKPTVPEFKLFSTTGATWIPNPNPPIPLQDAWTPYIPSQGGTGTIPWAPPSITYPIVTGVTGNVAGVGAALPNKSLPFDQLVSDLNKIHYSTDDSQ